MEYNKDEVVFPYGEHDPEATHDSPKKGHCRGDDVLCANMMARDILCSDCPGWVVEGQEDHLDFHDNQQW